MQEIKEIGKHLTIDRVAFVIVLVSMYCSFKEEVC